MQFLDAGVHFRPLVDDFAQAHAHLTLEDGMHGAVGRLGHAHDRGHGANVLQVKAIVFALLFGEDGEQFAWRGCCLVDSLYIARLDGHDRH